jgi:hypothetical protein
MPVPGRCSVHQGVGAANYVRSLRRALADFAAAAPPCPPCVALEGVARLPAATAAAQDVAAVAEWPEWGAVQGLPQEAVSAREALAECDAHSATTRSALTRALSSYHGRIVRLCLRSGQPQRALSYTAMLPAEPRLHSRLVVEAGKHGSLRDVQEALRLRAALGVPLDRCVQRLCCWPCGPAAVLKRHRYVVAVRLGASR